MNEAKVFKRIDKEDININEFQVYKHWDNITQANYTSSFGVNLYRAKFPTPGIYPAGIIPISSSLIANEPTNSDGSYQVLIWNSIKNYFYHENEGFWNSQGVSLQLYATASMFSIPQIKTGEQIKPKSVLISDKNISSSMPITIKDDGKGNLYDSSISSASFASASNLVVYFGFNERYNNLNASVDNSEISSFTPYNYELIQTNLFTGTGHNIKFEPGINTTGYKAASSGIKATFTGSGYVSIKHNELLNFDRTEDFAISFWLNLPTTQLITTTDYNTLIGKTGEINQSLFNRKTGEFYFAEDDTKKKKSPYKVQVYNQNTSDNGKLKASVHTGIREYAVTSSAFITGSDKHIIYQKSGSMYQIYINGALDTEVQYDIDKNVTNENNLMLGCTAKTRENISGSLDEVRIYNTYLTADQITSLSNNDYLSGSAYQTTRIGNVFYKTGIGIITDPRPTYQNTLFGYKGTQDYTGSLHGFDIEYRSTRTIYENQVLCRIRQDEFNMTLNPTIRVGEKMSSQKPKAYVSSSDWHPYITTVGLYDDYGRLLAVGKMASPLPKRSDIDTAILLKWDS